LERKDESKDLVFFKVFSLLPQILTLSQDAEIGRAEGWVGGVNSLPCPAGLHEERRIGKIGKVHSLTLEWCRAHRAVGHRR